MVLGDRVLAYATYLGVCLAIYKAFLQTHICFVTYSKRVTILYKQGAWSHINDVYNDNRNFSTNKHTCEMISIESMK